jgi:hypothetical protein
MTEKAKNAVKGLKKAFANNPACFSIEAILAVKISLKRGSFAEGCHIGIYFYNEGRPS